MPEASRGIPVNIAQHLSEMAALQPDRAAVICARGKGPHGEPAYEQLSFKQLDTLSNQLASGLDAIGIRRGVHTALMVPPSLDFFSLTFALFKVGAVPVLIDPGIGVRNLGRCLAQARPEAFVGIPKAHTARVLFGWARKSLRVTVTAGARWFWGGHTLRELMRPVPAAKLFHVAVQPHPQETAAILFTSGSTGIPKGAVYTHEMFGAQVHHIRTLYGIQPGEIDLATFPLFALFGPALGMTAVVPEMDPTRPANVDPTKIISAIQKFRVTNMFGSPALVNRVGRHGEAHGVRLPSLRRVISAGAPVPARTIARFTRMLDKSAQVFTPYGATECLPVASIGSDEILSQTAEMTDCGSGVCVGKPVAGLQARIIQIRDEAIPDWSDTLEVGIGEIGEIVVKALHASRSYFDMPGSTDLAKIQDRVNGGFYHRMGDLGYYDAAGRLWFCGRKSHRLLTSHGTLFSIPCEAVFNTHPQVFRTALVGVCRSGETIPVICVELELSAEKSPKGKIIEELQRIAVAYPHTENIKTFLFHGAFPVDIRHNAKIFREKLAVWAARKMK